MDTRFRIQTVFRVAVIASVAAWGGAPATAQTAGPALPASVTLDQVLTLLQERSPRTAADRATIAVTAAERISAHTLPNPSVSYGGAHLVQGLSTGAVTQHQVIVEQPLLLFHKRQARLDAADADVHAEEARVAEALAARRLAVRQAFAELLSRQEQLRVIQDSVTDLERVTQLVRARAAAGDRSQYEVLRIETETEALKVEAMNAVADVTDGSGQLSALLGLPGWLPHAEGSLEIGAVPTDMETLWTAAQRRRPSLVAIRRQQAASQAGLFLARRERLPVPALSGGTQMTRDVNGVSAFVGFSIPLNLFDHNQGAVAKATAQIEADDLTLQASLGEARAEVERAVAVLTKRRQALDQLRNTVVQRLPTLRRMAEDAYREGSADLIDLLDTNRMLKDLQVAHVQQIAAVKLAEEAVVSAAALDVAEPTP